jgi:hypothetical protein
MTHLKSRMARAAWMLASLAALAAALGASSKWHYPPARGDGAERLDKGRPTWCANAPFAGLTHLAGW